MKRYAIQALESSGEIRHLALNAATEHEAALEVLRQGLTPISILQRAPGLLDRLNQPIVWRRELKPGEGALFCEQMGTMVASGLTVEQALGVISRQQAQRNTTKIARRLLPRVQSGMALSAALATEPGLPAYLPAMVRAAEVGGKLAEGLGDASRYLQRQADTRNGLVAALAYPVVILLTVVAALILILFLVVPAFEPIFEGEEHRLPMITRVVLYLSDMAVHHLSNIMLIGFLLALLSAGALGRFPALRQHIGRACNGIRPVRLAHQLDVSRVLGVMAMLFNGGVEVSEAVGLGARAAGSRTLRSSLEDAARQLREGASISGALGRIDAIPEETRALIEVGEHTGELGATTLRAAQLLETDTAYQIGRLVALANPIAIALLGGIVGLVVGGVMLGILSINQLAFRS